MVGITQTAQLSATSGHKRETPFQRHQRGGLRLPHPGSLPTPSGGGRPIDLRLPVEHRRPGRVLGKLQASDRAAMIIRARDAGLDVLTPLRRARSEEGGHQVAARLEYAGVGVPRPSRRARAAGPGPGCARRPPALDQPDQPIEGRVDSPVTISTIGGGQLDATLASAAALRPAPPAGRERRPGRSSPAWALPALASVSAGLACSNLSNSASAAAKSPRASASSAAANRGSGPVPRPRRRPRAAGAADRLGPADDAVAHGRLEHRSTRPAPGPGAATPWNSGASLAADQRDHGRHRLQLPAPARCRGPRRRSAGRAGTCRRISVGDLDSASDSCCPVATRGE